MSTLGTFSRYANYGVIEDNRKKYEPGYADKARAKPTKQYESGQTNVERRPIYKAGETDVKYLPQYDKGATDIKRQPIYKQGQTDIKKVQYPEGANMPKAPSKGVMEARKARVAKRAAKGKNKLIAGAVLGGLGLTGLGAIAYNNRNSGRRSEMSFGSAFANFAEKQLELPLDIESKKFKRTELTDRQKAATEARKAQSSEDLKKVRESQKAFRGQRAIERNVDAGGDVYKGAKGMDYVSRTGALLGSPERNMIAAGKKSKNGFVKGLAEGAEGFGRAGYKTGAIGARGVLNKVVGRTATGKIARLGAAGIGLSAIGGAMKRNRQERG